MFFGSVRRVSYVIVTVVLVAFVSLGGGAAASRQPAVDFSLGLTVALVTIKRYVISTHASSFS